MKSREKMISTLERHYPEMTFRESEYFDGSEGSIWIAAEESSLDRSGLPIFDYWSEDYENYEFGVRTHLSNWANRNGWYFMWYDCGTMMLYPIK